MNRIRQVQQLNKRELDAGASLSASWHNDYRDTAFVYVGGLAPELSEGDVIAVFSQYGEPNFIHLARDRETGKSKGFCFLRYEDQRSADLAVDNLSGAKVLSRLLSVDHTRYRRREDERIYDNTYGEDGDADGAGAADDAVGSAESDARRGGLRRERERDEPPAPARPVLPAERELAELRRAHDDDDPMKDFLIREKEAEVAAAVEEWERAQRRERRGEREDGKDGRRRHHHHRRRHRRDRELECPDEGATARSPRPPKATDGSTPRRQRDRTASPAYEDREARRDHGRRPHRDDR